LLPTATALSAVLAARSAAVLAGSPAAVAATEAPGAVTPVRHAAAALPVSSWSYVDPVVVGARDGLVAVRATLRYQLALDGAATSTAVRLALRRDSGGWRVASERTDAGGAALWELGQVEVVRAGGIAVAWVGSGPPAGPDEPDAARQAAREAARAQAVVTRAWDAGPSGVPLIVVVPGRFELARALDRPAEALDGLGAVTVVGPHQAGGAAARVWVSREVLDSLSNLERQVLLRHELLHVASGRGARSGRPAPLWLSEGVAEQVGWAAAGRGPEVWARDLLATVRRDGVPPRLPADADFAGPGQRAAYGGAHLAVELIDAQAGRGRALEVLRRVLAGDDVDTALRALTGTGTGRLAARWRATAGSLAARGPGTIAP
jgi:hypothetical protein